MRLDILGACGTFPDAGGACSGYVLREDGFNLWMDAGTGTMGNLLRTRDVDEIGGVFLSHMHPDHFVDIYPLFYALSFHPSRPRNIPVLAPPGSLSYAGKLLSQDAKESFMEIFDWREIAPGHDTSLGPFRLAAFDSVHSAPNLTVRIVADGTTMCYSGDTGPNPDLVRAAAGADLFLCEASWQSDTQVGFGPIHLRAGEAGRVARDAGVKRLLLTHIWPTLDRDRSRDEAASEYDGPIEIARTRQGTDV